MARKPKPYTDTYEERRRQAIERAKADLGRKGAPGQWTPPITFIGPGREYSTVGPPPGPRGIWKDEGKGKAGAALLLAIGLGIGLWSFL